MMKNTHNPRHSTTKAAFSGRRCSKLRKTVQLLTNDASKAIVPALALALALVSYSTGAAASKASRLLGKTISPATSSTLGKAQGRTLAIKNPLFVAAGSMAKSKQSGDSIEALADLNIARTGHTATELLDGTVLIVGGENDNGAVRRAEIFKSGSRTFSLAARLSEPRAGHTATLLAGGLVLIAGGRTKQGDLNSTEIYNPATGSFSRGPSLNHPRARHTATLLSDGNILIAGGNPEASAEVFDLATGRFAVIESRLNQARTAHSAVLLQNGKVLIAGGLAEDGSRISSAEVFYPETRSFRATRTTMKEARLQPLLCLLDNGHVQVIGGDRERTMEMFNAEGEYFTARAHILSDSSSVAEVLKSPARAGLIQAAEGLFSTQSDGGAAFAGLLDREGHTLTDLGSAGGAIIAGGRTSKGTITTSVMTTASSSATVTTDKTDYSPGETVTITGTGWQPGEIVQLRLHRDGFDVESDTLLSAVAAADGTISNTDYVVRETDADLSFLLTATGQTSGRTAQTTFTDSVAQLAINSPTTASPVTVLALPAVITVSFTYRTSPTLITTGEAKVKSGATVIATSGSQTLPSGGMSPLPPLTDSINVSIPIGTANGSYDVELTLVNGTGISGTATRLQSGAVIVSGCAPPAIITCATDQSASADADCQAVVPDFTSDVITSGGCGTLTLSQNPVAGTIAGSGSTSVTITATDSNNNTATCDVTFTVNDTTAPVADVANLPDATGECSVTLTPPTATDNCAGTVAATTTDPLTYSTQGTFTVTWTYDDGNGNTSTQIQTVVVDDTIAPVPNFPALPIVTGQCMATVTAPTATDNCAGAVTATTGDPTTFTTQGMFTITWTYNDGNGNSSTQTQSVKVQDTENPTITLCAPNKSVFATANSLGEVPDFTADVTASDNCGGVAITQYPTAGTMVPVGNRTITIKAKDAAGNESQCTATLMVCYNFYGFLPPLPLVTGPNISQSVNVTKAGSSLPIKFKLNGYQGMSIFFMGYPTSRKVSCSSGEDEEPLQTIDTPGSSGLSYDPATDQYIYVWKTEKGWGGQCRQLVVRLADGKEYILNFRFTK